MTNYSHICVACGFKHANCCGLCPQWKPLTSAESMPNNDTPKHPSRDPSLCWCDGPTCADVLAGYDCREIISTSAPSDAARLDALERFYDGNTEMLWLIDLARKGLSQKQ